MPTCHNFVCSVRERYSRARRYHKPAFASERALQSSTEPIIQNAVVLFVASEDPCKGSTLAASYKMQHFVSASEHIEHSERRRAVNWRSRIVLFLPPAENLLSLSAEFFRRIACEATERNVNRAPQENMAVEIFSPQAEKYYCVPLTFRRWGFYIP